MAHVLIGWEFGGNRGHAAKILTAARAIQNLGHEVTFALQRVDALRPEELSGCDVWQAPLTPRLLVNSGRSKGGSTNSHGDTLAKLGLDEPSIVTAVIRSWHQIFAAVQPDIVCAEFAPLLLLAARGSIPTVAIGTGFTLPPATMDAFPSFTGSPGLPEERTLESLNRALASTGRPSLAQLPEIYSANEVVVGTIAELDPYRQFCSREVVSPCIPLPVEEAQGRREEIFVYAGPLVAPEAQLWSGLADTKLPVRLFIPDISSSYREGLRGRGFIVEEEAVPFKLIAARSRLLLSTGSHGLVCAGLLAGIPQVLCPYDLEKALIAADVAQLGVGGVAPLKGIIRQPFATSLQEIYENDDLAKRARNLSVVLQKRTVKPFRQFVAEAVERVA